MADVFRDEAALNDFLHTMHAAYVAGEQQELELPNGFKQEVVEEGPFRMVDTFHISEDETIFAGDYVVFVDGEPVWHNGYHTQINDPEALRFYFDSVITNPDPDLPVVGRLDLEDERLAYAWSPLDLRPLSLSRFLLNESMYTILADGDIDGHNLTYDGVHNGDWL